MDAAVLRVARPTDDIGALIPFYRDGLGLNILFEFEDHQGFDGIMFGMESCPYHLEFTRAHSHTVGRAPSQDNLLVFYLPESGEWKTVVDRMTAVGFEPVASFNPYWDQLGRTFEDPDGYRVVLQNAAWRS